MSANDKLASCIVNKMGKLWEDNILSDLRIIIDDVKFNCHRFHLSACSEVFRVMFQSDAIGFFNDVTTVTIQGIASETLRLLLASVYKGELTVNSENMLDLWHASHHLQIDFLVNELEYFISRNISDDNFLTIYTLAVELNSVRIMQLVHSFVAKNFDNISRTDDFLHLSFNCLQEVLGHDDLDMKSRDDLVSSVLKWVDFNPGSINRTGKVLKGSDVRLKEENSQGKQQFPHKTQGKKTTNTTDVVFKSRGDITNQIESSSERKENLGELMKIINLDDVSQDCLLALLNNDDVMECREARTLVRQAFTNSKVNKPVVKENSTQENFNSSDMLNTHEEFHFDMPDVFEDKTPVIVYFQIEFGAILAYNLDTSKTCSIPRNGLPMDWFIESMYSHTNHLYLVLVDSRDQRLNRRIYKLQENDQWLYLIEAPKGSSHFMFNDKYIYCIVEGGGQLCRLNMECTHNLVWVHVFNFFSMNFVVSGNKLLYQTKKTFPIDRHPNYNVIITKYTKRRVASQCELTTVSYIDLKSLASGDCDDWLMDSSENLSQVESFDGDELFTSPSGAVMKHSHLLTEKGRLLHVTHPSDTTLNVTPEEILFANEKPVLRAVKYKNILYFFQRHAAEVCEPTNEKLTSFSEIRVIPLSYPSTTCVPLMAPKRWLNWEI